MEAALKEFEKIFDCCAQCRENKGEAREVELRKARLSNAELLADSVVVHRKGDVFELVYGENSDEEEQQNVIVCRQLREKGFHVDLSRPLIIPEDTPHVLRLIDRYAELYVVECRFDELVRPSGSVRNMLRTVMAKVDFTLMERGVDLEELFDIVDFPPFYIRKRDIRLCGQSTQLVNHYLNALKKNKAVSIEDAKPSFNSPALWTSDTDEAKDWESMIIFEYSQDRVYEALSSGKAEADVDWELLEGDNLDLFKENIRSLVGSPEQLRPSLLYLVSRFVTKLNDNSSFSFSADSGQAQLRAQNDWLIHRYLSQLLYKELALDPSCCFFGLCQDLGLEIKFFNSEFFTILISSGLRIDKRVYLRMRMDQCDRCNAVGCKFRLSSIKSSDDEQSNESHELQSSYYKALVAALQVPEEEVVTRYLINDAKDTVDMVDQNDVKNCTNYEASRCEPCARAEEIRKWCKGLANSPIINLDSVLSLFDHLNRHFPKKHLKDIAVLYESFRRDCTSQAESNSSFMDKKLWVNDALWTLNAAFYEAKAQNDVVIQAAVMRYLAIMQASYMRSPKGLCVLHMCHSFQMDSFIAELAPSSVVSREHLEANFLPNDRHVWFYYALRDEMGWQMKANLAEYCSKCEVIDHYRCPHRIEFHGIGQKDGKSRRSMPKKKPITYDKYKRLRDVVDEICQYLDTNAKGYVKMTNSAVKWSFKKPAVLYAYMGAKLRVHFDIDRVPWTQIAKIVSVTGASALKNYGSLYYQALTTRKYEDTQIFPDGYQKIDEAFNSLTPSKKRK